MRIGFKMYLSPNCSTEYKKRHNDIWPELVELLKKSGISEYSIFYDKSDDSLFAFHHLQGGSSAADLGDEDIVKKWWKHMSDIMKVNTDYSPVVIPLDEVFYLK